MNLFSVLTSKLFGGLLVVVSIAFILQTVVLDRTRDKLEIARLERDAALRDVKRLLDEADRRKAAGRQAIEADKPKAEARAKARTIIQYRESECETPPDIIEAIEQGWKR